MNSVINFFISSQNYILAKKPSTDNNKANKDIPEKDRAQLSLREKWNEHILLIEEKTGISGNVVIIFLICCMIMVLFGFLEKIIMNAIGTFYPAYWSIKAIEAIESNSEDKEEEKHWLTYWVVFSLFTVFDLLTLGFVLKFIPFYFFFKIIFLIWLFMPNFKGATILYVLIIERLYKKYEKHIESATEHVRKNFEKVINKEQSEFTKVKDDLKEGPKEAEDAVLSDNGIKKKLE